MRLDDGQIEVMDDAMVEIYRRMTTWQRLQVAFDMWDCTRGRGWKPRCGGCTRSGITKT